jgi:hypothetical protein
MGLFRQERQFDKSAHVEPVAPQARIFKIDRAGGFQARYSWRSCQACKLPDTTHDEADRGTRSYSWLRDGLARSACKGTRVYLTLLFESGSSRRSSRPACSGFTHVTARWIAQPPKAAFVARLQPSQLPGQAARQLPDQWTIIWVRSSLTDDSRLRGARPIECIAKSRYIQFAVG